MLSNVISIIGIVATIIRVLVNRQSKRHVAALAIYIDEHPSELNINY
ncbi:hypothetical protein FACS189459_5460 [Bacilli bacterium]|nr:hypothetical protein FACS189459_5460 [Bacilli bacterium]